MFNNIYIKIISVFICLYIFLVGISGLSKSIGGLTTPSELSVGDMAQLKKQTLTIDGQERVNLFKDDIVSVNKANYYAELVILPFNDYISTLKEKLHWSGNSNDF